MERFVQFPRCLMSPFPAADPIPLPAPVWLFKLLHSVTFALHLSAVDLLLGGMMIGLVLHIAGSMRGSPELLNVSGMLAHRLPTVMAFVINLGIPPLLFAQVLYGRALYTSSVLMGAYWISVIFLLMGSYLALYLSAKRAEMRRGWIGAGLAALALALTISFIYSNNMTLMLRPQAWAALYRNSPSGVQWNLDDPTLLLRWHFFLAGALPGAAAALLLLAMKTGAGAGERSLLRRGGGLVLAAGVLAEGVLGYFTFAAQPHQVTSRLMASGFYAPFVFVWITTAAGMLLAGIAAWITAAGQKMVAIGAALLAFLNIAATVMIRDGVRDLTLRDRGFNVWDRVVVTNWSVVGVFLVLFVAAAGTVFYLIRVVATAARNKEQYA